MIYTRTKSRHPIWVFSYRSNRKKMIFTIHNEVIHVLYLQLKYHNDQTMFNVTIEPKSELSNKRTKAMCSSPKFFMPWTIIVSLSLFPCTKWLRKAKSQIFQSTILMHVLCTDLKKVKPHLHTVIKRNMIGRRVTKKSMVVDFSVAMNRGWATSIL